MEFFFSVQTDATDDRYNAVTQTIRKRRARLDCILRIVSLTIKCYVKYFSGME